MRNMIDTFTGLDVLNIGDHGDARERDIWPTVATALSQYEPFWRTLIVLLTNRIEPNIPVGPKRIRLRPRLCEKAGREVWPECLRCRSQKSGMF